MCILDDEVAKVAPVSSVAVMVTLADRRDLQRTEPHRQSRSPVVPVGEHPLIGEDDHVTATQGSHRLILEVAGTASRHTHAREVVLPTVEHRVGKYRRFLALEHRHRHAVVALDSVQPEKALLKVVALELQQLVHPCHHAVAAALHSVAVVGVVEHHLAASAHPLVVELPKHRRAIPCRPDAPVHDGLVGVIAEDRAQPHREGVAVVEPHRLAVHVLDDVRPQRLDGLHIPGPFRPLHPVLVFLEVLAGRVVVSAAVLMVALAHLCGDGFARGIHIRHEALRPSAAGACQPMSVGGLHLAVFGKVVGVFCRG